MFFLQNRWKLQGRTLYCYGLRNRENLLRRRIRLTRAQYALVSSLPRTLTEKEKRILSPLLGGPVVRKEELRTTPRSFAEARFCSECCANDFLIPGLEFDEAGRCPLCQTAEETKELKSILPIVRNIPHAKKSRFDIALFYTGGKDSTFLLYHLAKMQGLRVLALTWETPFLSDSAKASIEGAKRAFPNVEFLSRQVAETDLRRIYRKLYALSENTCACPSLAYVLFYPELVENRVPYFAAGNEPVQMLGLYYNGMAPRIAYSFAQNRPLTALLNLGRVLTLRPALRQGQFQTLMTMRQLAWGDPLLKKISGYSDELVTNIVAALLEVPELLTPLKRSIRRSDRTGNVPAFVHFDLDEICGGTYDWNRVREILVRECGWVPPSEETKALHTSCRIERCKDHSQFVRFYHCRSRMIPFSALEIALASRRCGRSRAEFLTEMERNLGFSLEPVPECAEMCAWTEELP
ncbi:MAG: hypothetical protein IJD06_00045 [Clostridia bacterium]|nr:hypothetical protein [Clostridia bacterium]